MACYGKRQSTTELNVHFTTRSVSRKGGGVCLIFFYKCLHVCVCDSTRLNYNKVGINEINLLCAISIIIDIIQLGEHDSEHKFSA